MGLITAKGAAAMQSAAQKNIDLSEIMIRLKDKETVRVRLLTSYDYVEYQAVSSFNLGVYTQPSREPLGEKDYFVEAAKLAKAGKVDEKFDTLYPRKRYLIAMADIDSGKLRAWDASKTQFNTFVSAVEEYKEVIDDPEEEIIFTFKRTGNKMETTYSLSPIMRMKDNDKEAYHSFDETMADEAFFESLLIPRSPELQVSVLKEAGFPVEEYFPEIDLTEVEGAGSAEKAEEASPLDSI